MLKKRILLMVVFIVLLFASGCKSNEAQTMGKVVSNEKAKNETIDFAYIAASVTSPQAIINQKYEIFASELVKMGSKVNFISTRSLDNVWPLMDKEQGSPEFVYIPAANFATYVTKTSKFGGSDKYIIIAGSFNSNGTVLITNPSIKSLKDLDGKKIGIANNRYIDEFQLNKLLNTVGLATDSTGGTVQVVWDDIVPTLLENWSKGQYDAIVLYSAGNYPIALSKVKDSKILTTLNPDKLFGEKAPRYWLITKKELLKVNPDLVKEVLRAHVMSTEKAIAEKEMLPEISREMYLQYFRDQNVLMDDILKTNTLEVFQKRWQEAEITYDPNYNYVSEVFEFLSRKGLMKGKSLNNFVQVELLNKVLDEMGKPKVK